MSELSIPQQLSLIPNTSPFERIKHTDANGEYWIARELQPLLEYTRWQQFAEVIERAKIACENSGQAADDHFRLVGKMVSIGSGAKRNAADYRLTRYACYMVALNGDPRKQAVSLAQTYFAVQTRRQEVADSHPMTALDAAESIVKALRELDNQTRQNTQDIADLKAHTRSDSPYVTLKGWYIRNHMPIPPSSELARLGIVATKVSRANGYAVGNTPDEAWGTVHTYHIDILNHLLGGKILPLQEN